MEYRVFPSLFLSLIAILFLMSALLWPSEAFSACSFENPPTVIEGKTTTDTVLRPIEAVTLIWNEEFKDEFFEPYEEENESYDDYLDWLETQTDTDPFFLIRRQRDFWHEHNLNTPNHDMILDGNLGLIRPINCLEALLFLEHDYHYPLDEKPSEFFAYILSDEIENKLRIYFISDESYIGHSKPFSEEVSEDLENGWIYLAGLHNHPIDNRVGSGDWMGPLVPSDGDRNIFRLHKAEMAIQNAWITNGIDTIEITSDEFDLLKEDKKKTP